jgi:hypothetical protein
MHPALQVCLSLRHACTCAACKELQSSLKSWLESCVSRVRQEGEQVLMESPLCIQQCFYISDVRGLGLSTSYV